MKVFRTYEFSQVTFDLRWPSIRVENRAGSVSASKILMRCLADSTEENVRYHVGSVGSVADVLCTVRGMADSNLPLLD